MNNKERLSNIYAFLKAIFWDGAFKKALAFIDILGLAIAISPVPIVEWLSKSINFTEQLTRSGALSIR